MERQRHPRDDSRSQQSRHHLRDFRFLQTGRTGHLDRSRRHASGVVQRSRRQPPFRISTCLTQTARLELNLTQAPKPSDKTLAYLDKLASDTLSDPKASDAEQTCAREIILALATVKNP